MSDRIYLGYRLKYDPDQPEGKCECCGTDTVLYESPIDKFEWLCDGCYVVAERVMMLEEDDDDDEITVADSLTESLQEMELMRQGELPKRSWRDMMDDIRPIRPTFIEMDEDEYDEFMDRFYSGKSKDEEGMAKLREEFHEYRKRKGKRV